MLHLSYTFYKKGFDFTMPAPEITAAQSLRNFTNASMLSAPDIARVLCQWRDAIEKSRTRVAFCPDSRKVLANTVDAMLDYVRAARLHVIQPAVTGTQYRYSLDWYHDGLQLGIERFAEGASFRPDGEPDIPMEICEDADGDEPGDVPYYVLVHKVPVPAWPIEDWAERNGVKPATARQWFLRGRIRGIKQAGAVRISSIQYTPNAQRDTSGMAYRFKFLPALPEKIVSKHPILSGTVLDLVLAPVEQSGPDEAPPDPKSVKYRVISIHSEQKGESVRADTETISRVARDKLLDALLEIDGVSPVSDKYLMQPLDAYQDGRPVHHPVMPVPDKSAVARLRTMEMSVKLSPGETRSMLDAVPDCIAFEILLRSRDGNDAFFRLQGRYGIDASGMFPKMSPQYRLQALICEDPDGFQGMLRTYVLDGKFARAMGATYPYAVIVDKIEHDGVERPDGVLRSAGFLFRHALCVSPDFMLVPAEALSSAGLDMAACGLYRDEGNPCAYGYFYDGPVLTGFRRN